MPDFAALRGPCRVYASAATTLAANVFTKVTGLVVDYDPSSMFDVAAQRVWVPAAGYYHVSGLVVALGNNNPQGLTVAIYVNGAAATNGTDVQDHGAAAGQPFKSLAADVLHLAQGDLVELYAFNRGGNPINTSTGASQTRLTVARREGPAQ